MNGQRGAGVERMLAALGQAGSRIVQNGAEYKAQCTHPDHEDHEPSLGIAQGDKGALVRCRSRDCDLDGILAPLKLTRRDLFDNAQARQDDGEWTPYGPAVAIYDYTDEDGNLLFQVCRTADKKFPQRVPDPSRKSGWRWKIGDTRLVPYRLPRLLSGICERKVIYIAEGERDVHALEAAGVVATCNPGGAGKWKAEYDQYLVGATEVRIAEDKDEAGRKHGLNIAEGLRRAGIQVQILEALEGKDAADHFAAGHGLDAFTLVQSEPAERPEPESRADSTGRGPSAATILVRYAQEFYTFHRDQYDEPYALPLTGPRIARYLRGARSLRAQLNLAYLLAERKPANSSALADALGAIEGLAFAGTVQDTSLRVAGDDSGSYLDLGRDDGTAVKITSAGWEIVPAAPMVWRRTRKIRSMPDPVPGAGLGELWALARVPEEERPLVVAWQLCALLDRVATILDVIGEHGSGKTSAARAIASPVDTASAATVPTKMDDLLVGAHARWITIIDNLSHLQPWLSDALCRVVTGQEVDRRMLWTDSDVATITLRRPIMTTSIALEAVPADYADRRASIHVPVLDEADGMSESTWNARLAAAQPKIMGALLDIACKVLGKLPSITLDRTPRMGDYSEVLAAVDEVLPAAQVRNRAGQVIGTLTGLQAYRRQRGEVAADTVDSDIVGRVLLDWAGSLPEAAPGSPAWRGSMTELLERITPDPAPEKEWPKSPKGLSSRVTALAPSLRKVGLDVTATDEKEKTTRRAIWQIQRVPAESFNPSNPSDAASDQPEQPEGSSEGSPGPVPDPSPDPSDEVKDRDGPNFNPSGILQASDLGLEGSEALKDCAGSSPISSDASESPSSVEDDGGFWAHDTGAAMAVAAPEGAAVIDLLQRTLGAELIETSANGRSHAPTKTIEPDRCQKCGETEDSYWHAVSCLGEGRSR